MASGFEDGEDGDEDSDEEAPQLTEVLKAKNFAKEIKKEEPMKVCYLFLLHKTTILR